MFGSVMKDLLNTNFDDITGRYSVFWAHSNKKLYNHTIQFIEY